MSNLDVTISSFWQLEIQLGPSAAPCPGAPDVRGERPGPNHGPQHHQEPVQQRPWQRGPSARARDAARRAAWLKKQEERQQKVPAENVMDIHSTETLESSENGNTSSDVTLEISEANIETDNSQYFDLCEHKSQTKGGLNIHIGRKHKDIPQLYGEVQMGRETDGWWEKNSIISLKTLKVFDEVIEDIKEMNLTGEEKSIEIDRAIEARMEGWDDPKGILEKIKLLKQKRSESLAAKEKLHC